MLERGWLSSNNIVFGAGPSGAAIVDTGYCTHAVQTLELVEAVLQGRALRRIVNTHLHSDHCGGNAALQARWACETQVPASSWQAVSDWDEDVLTYAYTGQTCPRFVAQGALSVGGLVELGGWMWTVLSAKGHDPDAVMLFQPDARVLIAGDALWESRLAIVFPELVGVSGFEEARNTLQQIEVLDPAVVIPGHGQPFTDVESAVKTARGLLDRFLMQPSAHHLHAARALLMFRLLEIRSCTQCQAVDWLCGTAIFVDIWKACDHQPETLDAFATAVIEQLLRTGALRQTADGMLSVAR